MIKVEVDMNKCQHYGQCVFEAPTVFKLNAEDKLEYVAEVDDSERTTSRQQLTFARCRLFASRSNLSFCLLR